jgi:prepilin peptidase CpaA
MAWPTIARLPEAMILACLSVAVATDLASRIIPNRLVLLVLCAGIALRLLSGPGSLWLGVLGPVAVLMTMALLASRDLVGWGDAKLIAAVSVAVPADRLPTLLLAIALAGGLLSCLYLASR